ncbi:hypothetical protein L7F22_062622 [Adiantum nelumboides]|nr:hypothetical protein [Adiantum nelumboides]
MEVQCDACSQAAATLFCCADGAALCAECDIRVHAANKLAGKHERLPLSIHHPPSSCDICQEKAGFFFCVEDRAVLCRDCDVSIHTANNLTRKHKRFLVSGVRVGLDAMVPPSLPSKALGLDTMALPSSSHSSIRCFSLESRPKKDNQKSDRATMENTHHREAQPRSLQPSGFEARDSHTLTSIGVVESQPCTAPHVSLSQPSILGPSSNNLASHPAASSSTYFINCLAHLDELLNGSPASTSTEIPIMINTPNAGWGVSDSTFALDVLQASASLFDNSLAEVFYYPIYGNEHWKYVIEVAPRSQHIFEERDSPEKMVENEEFLHFIDEEEPAAIVSEKEEDQQKQSEEEEEEDEF